MNDFPLSLKNIVAVLIIIFIVFKVYFSTVIYANMTMWYLLWYCNLMWILLAVAILTNNKTLASVALVTSTIQIAWYVELIATIFDFNHNLHVDLLTYLFEYDTNPLMINIANTMDFMIHLLLLPASFYVVKKMGFNHRCLNAALLFVTLLLVLSFITSFVVPNFHINCISIAAECGLFDTVHNRWMHFLLAMITAVIWCLIAFLLLSKLFKKQTI